MSQKATLIITVSNYVTMLTREGNGRGLGGDPRGFSNTSGNFKLLMCLFCTYYDGCLMISLYLSDIFTALVIAHEKLNVLRKTFNH